MRTCLLFARVSAFAAGGTTAPAAVALNVSRDIRPSFSDNGFKGHGPDAAAREAKRRVELRAEALADYSTTLARLALAVGTVR